MNKHQAFLDRPPVNKYHFPDWSLNKGVQFPFIARSAFVLTILDMRHRYEWKTPDYLL